MISRNCLTVSFRTQLNPEGGHAQQLALFLDGKFVDWGAFRVVDIRVKANAPVQIDQVFEQKPTSTVGGDRAPF